MLKYIIIVTLLLTSSASAATNREIVSYEDYTIRLEIAYRTNKDPRILSEFIVACKWLKANYSIDYCMQYKGHQNMLGAARVLFK